MSLQDLKKDLKDRKAHFGFNKTIKLVKASKCNVVYISDNCPFEVELISNCHTAGIRLIKINESNKELGVICKKRFSVSVVCFE